MAVNNGSVSDVFELWQSAYSGDAAKLQELLSDPAISNKINYSMKSQGNHTALFFACYGSANAETIKVLINAGADPFQRDDKGRLPLHFAANTKDADLIATLLAVPNMRDFRLDMTSHNGQTPFHALFLPDLGIGITAKSKSADISKCLPHFLEVGHDPLGVLHKKDHNGLSSLMLVKHYQHQAAFHPYVGPKTFEILLKSVIVPANIEELLKADLSAPQKEFSLASEEVSELQEITMERRESIAHK
ncbi:MAG TPA: ankyrin repeat domain-containing protein [Gammaproteobacteria bacterium]|nr:ankyrin repeat domain-containing protein [Gammaproteobacteria bacterium]